MAACPDGRNKRKIELSCDQACTSYEYCMHCNLALCGAVRLCPDLSGSVRLCLALSSSVRVCLVLSNSVRLFLALFGSVRLCLALSALSGSVRLDQALSGIGRAYGTEMKTNKNKDTVSYTEINLASFITQSRIQSKLTCLHAAYRSFFTAFRHRQKQIVFYEKLHAVATESTSM